MPLGGYEDPTLTDWAGSKGVEIVKRTAEGWQLCDPLKVKRPARKQKQKPQQQREEVSAAVDWNDVDAEGEDDEA